MEKFLRRVHFVAIAVIGIQVLIWTVTGFAFTFFDFQDVRGNYEKADSTSDLDMNYDLAKARATLGPKIVLEARCKRVAGRPVIDFRTPEGPVLVEGSRIISPLSEADAVEVARHALKQPPAVRRVSIQEKQIAEFDSELPAWRVEFDDRKNTTIYVSPTTGEVTARRNAKWRQFDLLWSLHVLGYIDRSNPANWPLRIVGGLALFVALSGTGIALCRIGGKSHE